MKTPILHCYFGTLLPADIDPNAKYVYILRRSIAKIGKNVETFTHTHKLLNVVLLIIIWCFSIHFVRLSDAFVVSVTTEKDATMQCITDVAKHFITGSVNGQFIGSMKKLTQEIIPLAFNNQFQEPKITNILLLDNEHDAGTNTVQHIECPTDSAYITRPSDFRIKSICNGRNVEFNDHTEHSSDMQLHKNGTTTVAPKSMRTLFDKFIAEFNSSVERYYEYLIDLKLRQLVHHIYVSFEFFFQLIASNDMISSFCSVYLSLVRNLSLAETEFNLATAYNATGQENITDEDDKEKIIVQPIIGSIEKCTKEQLEDIVSGWIRHIKRIFKLYKQKVVYKKMRSCQFKF